MDPKGHSGAGVAIGGFMGVGKTTVGRRLADRLGLPFVDTDEVLAARFGPIAAQFAEEGEAVFRARERALVIELCDGVPRVIATGGGVWADPESRRRLRDRYFTVVLTAPLELLRARLGSAPGRPLWSRAEALFHERREAYADAELVLDVAGREVDELVEAIACRLPST